MPLARSYDAAKGAVTVTPQSGYLDRLSRWSDIQEYLPFLHEQAKRKENTWVLELGARTGNSTLAFLAGVAETGGHVWSVDITDVTRDARGMAPWKGSRRWTFIHGDDMNPAVQAALPRKVDVLFLDTSHEYDHTLAELRAYMPRVVKGGTALFHDTNLFLNLAGDLISSLIPHRGETIPPVTQALDDYCKETGLSWENLPGEYGMGYIRP